METSPVVVIGAGPAGLAVSRELGLLGIEHIVLEQAQVGQSWRRLWDSFFLTTPNWTIRLPGAPYAGPDPEGFSSRDEIVAYLDMYAAALPAPVCTGVRVNRLEAGPDDRFVLHSTGGPIDAEAVVVCTGAYQRPYQPPAARRLRDSLREEAVMIDAASYHSPGGLPPGKVLVVGSGQTGCQLAEELLLAGREVALSCGRAPWSLRRFEDRDSVSWLADAGFFDTPLSSLPAPAARLAANGQSTGRDGGHDLHYRTLQAAGVRLLGRLDAIEDGQLRFADDLAESVAFGDARYDDLRQLLRTQLPQQGQQVPEIPDPPPFHAEPTGELDPHDLAAVIFATGYRPEYTRWIRFPTFDKFGFPVTTDGTSTVVPGLYFCGVHFLRTRASALLLGVGDDAAIVAQSVSRSATGT